MDFFQKNILLFVILTIGLSFLFSFSFNLILLKFSQNLGTRSNSENEIRWNKLSKPSLGGISFYLTFQIGRAHV